MVDTDKTWLGVVLAKHARDNSVVGILSVESEPGVGVGDNYASVIVRSTLKVVLGSGEVTTKKVIFKKLSSDISEELAHDFLRAFNIEGILYNNILHKCETLIRDYGLSYEKFWPDCMYTSHNVIIFEDLKTSGFSLAPRKIGLDLQHAEIVFTNLARLHSLSLVAVSNGTIFPNTLPPYLMMDSLTPRTFLRTALTSLADVIRDTWGPDWSEVEKKIRTMIENILETLKNLYVEKHKLSVVNHGDCWVNNMMFKYDSRGSPVDHKFLDFQLSHYNSYGWDLSYLLYTSFHPKYIFSSYDSFIEIYCREFSNNLSRLGHDKSRAPSTDDVKQELIRLSPFSLTIACAVLPITTNRADVKISVDDLISDSTKFRQLYEDKSFEKTLQEMLTNFINLGVL